MWEPLLSLYLAAFAVHAIFALGSVAAARIWRIPVRKIAIGDVPLLRRDEFELGVFPATGHVRMADSRDGEPASVHTFDRQPRLVRALVMLAGPLALLTAGSLILAEHAMASLLHGFSQILSGALQPRTVGADLVVRLLEQLGSSSALFALGSFLIKSAAFNLLPIPIMGGGAALYELLGPPPASPADLRWRQRLQKISLWLILPVYLSWMVAIGFAFQRLYHAG